jgi:hypothetical protein
MAIEAIAIEGSVAGVSTKVARLIDTCSRGWERFFADNDDHQAPRFVPSVPEMVFAGFCRKFCSVRGELALQGGTLFHHLPQHLAPQGAELVLLGLQLVDHGVTELRHPFGNHDALRVQEPMHFINQRRPLAHEPLEFPGFDLHDLDALASR